MRFGHQLHGQKRYIGDEHQDKGNGYYCNLEYCLHLLPPFGVSVWTVSGMKLIAFVPLGGTKVNRASATAGAMFQSLMTAVMLSSSGVPRVGDDILARQRPAAVRDPYLKVDTRAAEEQMIALDPADKRLADHLRQGHILHQ